MIAAFGFLRLFLAVVLLILGLIFRFGDIPPNRSFGLTLPWTYADEEIWRRSNRRLGTLVLLWWAWTVFQLSVGHPESWLTALWAPLFLVLVAAFSHSARLYQQRYHTLRVARRSPPDDRPYPARGGWLAVILREMLPMTVLLAPILIIRGLGAELPERIPVRWNPVDGPIDWRFREEALTLLRHQTMVVYLALALLEGGELLWRWFRGAHRDIARVMLTRRHWLYFTFKLGWVTLFAGVNLGFVYYSRRDAPLAPFLIPGFALLALQGYLIASEVRRAEFRPPEAP